MIMLRKHFDEVEPVGDTGYLGDPAVYIRRM